MRAITEHLPAEGANPVMVVAMDNPTPGHPVARYDVTGFNTVYNPAADAGGMTARFTRLPIIFQSNPDLPADIPQDGISTEALLAVLADHLNSQQHTPQACMEYQEALAGVFAALNALGMRRQRVAAGPAFLLHHHQAA